ncbi:MAG: hypothetical protein K2H31_12005 [Lachnospiraceae bacterium]|nr:hypothetical protein [Lachnospiraceae bacterium]
MKQEIFKSMYNKIGLSEEQKDGIYKELEEAAETGKTAKKVRFTTRAAVFAVLFLLSGMTVFAVGRFSLEDKFAEAMHPRHEHNLTPDQKGFYEQYGQVLDEEIETYYGTLKLEAVLYDDYYLLIPYSYDMNPEDDGNREQFSGIGIDGIAFVANANSDYISYPLDQCRYYSSSDDGIISGSYIFSQTDNETFEPGEVIQVYTKKRATTSYVDKFLTEFTLGTKVDRVNLTIDEQTRKAFEENGIMIEEISVSPISIFYSGISSFKSIYTKLYVVLKNGSEVECYYGGNDSSERKEGKLLEEYPYSVNYSNMFTAPINLEEVEGIRIKTGKTHIWIPMEYDD